MKPEYPSQPNLNVSASTATRSLRFWLVTALTGAAPGLAGGASGGLFTPTMTTGALLGGLLGHAWNLAGRINGELRGHWIVRIPGCRKSRADFRLGARIGIDTTHGCDKGAHAPGRNRRHAGRATN